jgi:hypothetical protein
MEKEFRTIRLIKEDVMFLGLIKNSGTPVFRGDDTVLYTAICPDDLKFGARGNIVYKANAAGGNHYFEPVDVVTADQQHSFEPTDTEGHSMECTKCGRAINIYSPEDWDKGLVEKCEGEPT